MQRSQHVVSWERALGSLHVKALGSEGGVTKTITPADPPPLSSPSPLAGYLFVMFVHSFIWFQKGAGRARVGQWDGWGWGTAGLGCGVGVTQLYCMSWGRGACMHTYMLAGRRCGSTKQKGVKWDNSLPLPPPSSLLCFPYIEKRLAYSARQRDGLAGLRQTGAVVAHLPNGREGACSLCGPLSWG